MAEGRDVRSSGSGGSGDSGEASGSTAVETVATDVARGVGDLKERKRDQDQSLERDFTSGEVQAWAVRVNSRGNELDDQTQAHAEDHHEWDLRHVGGG